jgi:glutamyl-tRNA synthetase
MGDTVRELVPADSFTAFIEAVRGNISFPADALRWARIVFMDKLVVSHAAREAMMVAGPEFFATARQALEKHGADFRAVAETVKQVRSVSGKSLFQPLRAALLGELDGPEMAKLLPLIGVERARKRLSI